MPSVNEKVCCGNCGREDSTSETEVDSEIRKAKESFSTTKRSMALDDVRTKKLKADFLGQMESRLNAMIDDVIENVQKTEFPERLSMMLDPEMMQDKRKASVVGKLPIKEFRSRPSPLTELLAVPHIKTIHHIFIAALFLVMMHSILMDFIESNTVDLGIERLKIIFAKPLTTLGILLMMEFLALFILYPSFYHWSASRLYDEETRKMMDYGALAAFVAFMTGFIYFPARCLLRNSLGVGTGALVTMEQGRLLMKMYAFVRSNVPRALIFGTKYENKDAAIQKEVEDENKNEDSSDIAGGIRHRNKVKETGANGRMKNWEERKNLRKRESWISWDDENTPCPSYSRYLYFYFAPTLIYKDKYPRTLEIRWGYVCSNFAQVFGSILYLNMVMGKSVSVFFSKVGPNYSLTPPMLCNAVFSLMLPGIFTLVLSFFLLLHAWHNAFAEMLRFGDRLFYKDWWNKTSFSDYYKTWNVLVHDWLYTYVFKDAWESGLGRIHKALPTTLVFLVSSVFHEYILAVSLGFFLPVLFVLFGGFGFALVFVRSNHGAVGNVLMWVGLTAGMGICLTAYSIEAFSRFNNCPPVSEVFQFYNWLILH